MDDNTLNNEIDVFAKQADLDNTEKVFVKNIIQQGMFFKHIYYYLFLDFVENYLGEKLTEYSLENFFQKITESINEVQGCLRVKNILKRMLCIN